MISDGLATSIDTRLILALLNAVRKIHPDARENETFEDEKTESEIENGRSFLLSERRDRARSLINANG